jgi:hypothetical protein
VSTPGTVKTLALATLILLLFASRSAPAESFSVRLGAGVSTHEDASRTGDGYPLGVPWYLALGAPLGEHWTLEFELKQWVQGALTSGVDGLSFSAGATWRFAPVAWPVRPFATLGLGLGLAWLDDSEAYAESRRSGPAHLELGLGVGGPIWKHLHWRLDGRLRVGFPSHPELITPMLLAGLELRL